MKKGMSVFLTVVCVMMIIGGIELLLFSALYKETLSEIKNMSDVNISDITDTTSIYAEKIDVIKRYAFRTIDEYRDSEGTYIDTNYYVYEASQPMDDNELDVEYYIVRFKDSSGNEYIASLTVSADDPIAKKLADCPITLSACVGASPISDSKLLNSYDEDLLKIRESALAEYSESTGLPRAKISLGYQNETAEERQEDFQNGVTSAKITSLVFGILLLIGAALIIVYIRKKKKLNQH